MKYLKRFFAKQGRVSYAQCGEDLIVDFVLKSLNISNPSYLDIGAHHPIKLNNTYLFYKMGCRGVCVEPDPEFYFYLKRKRKQDICLNVGVGPTLKGSADFYVMSSKTLSTFSKNEADRYQNYGNQRIRKVLQIPLVPINDILQDYFQKGPDFISLDVEGTDFAVLESIDFAAFRPSVFCIETLTYSEDKSERKILETIHFMHENGYLSYGDTYINTIFVDRKRWRDR